MKAVIRFTFCNVTTDGEVGGLSTVVVRGDEYFSGSPTLTHIERKLM